MGVMGLYETENLFSALAALQLPAWMFVPFVCTFLPPRKSLVIGHRAVARKVEAMADK